MPRVVTAQEIVLPGLPRHERLEGTFTLTQNGLTASAQLRFQAPDRLRIDITANEAALLPAQTIVAAGEETLLLEPENKRVLRLPYNVAKEPWRSRDLRSGGPANLLLFGFPQASLNRFYQISKDAAPDNAGGWTLTAKPDVGQRFARESARFGGTGEGAFYAAHQRAVFDRPARIRLLAGTGNSYRLEEFDEDGQPVVTARMTFAANGFPLTATLSDARGTTLSQWNYALQPRAEAFPNETFQFPLPPEQIVEDATLRPLSEYSGNEANALWNKGVALAAHTEDYAQALAALDAAGQQKPKAVAPPRASFDIAFSIRDLDRATTALTRLAGVLGEEHFEVATRRASLAAARRERDLAHTALEAAHRARPENHTVTLLLADALRVRREYPKARDLLLEVLKGPQGQLETRVAAAEMLAEIADEKMMGTLLAELPRDTQWQRLARALLQIKGGQNLADAQLQEPRALASLAAAQALRDRNAAIQTWTKLAQGTTPAQQAAAQAHLMALHAQQGNIAASLAAYRQLSVLADSEASRQSAREGLLEAWRKAFRQDQLRQTLQQRAVATAATEDDSRLWLAYQSAYGTEEDYERALNNGVARYSNSAWWQSQRAENLSGQVSGSGFTPAAEAARAQLVSQSLEAVDKAIAQEPRQPYYAVQRALVLTSRATLKTGVTDATTKVATRRAAHDSLDALAAKWPDNPDVQLSIALQRLALEPEGSKNLDPIITQLQKVLQTGVPSQDGNDRHLFVSAARQALAAAYRRQGRLPEAAAQYELLLAAARTAGEQGGIARNYLTLLMQNNNAPAVARLLTRLSREPWEYSGSEELMAIVLSSVVARRPLSTQVATLLRADKNPYSQLAAVQMDALLLRVAAAEAAQPEPPVAAEAAFATAGRNLSTSVQNLQPLAGSADKLVAARASAALAEAIINRQAGAVQAGAATDTDYTRVAELLKFASVIEPRDLNLRVAYAQSLVAAGQKEQALAERDDVLQALPHTPENLRRAASLSLRLNDTKEAVRLAALAAEATRAAPEAAPVELQSATFVLARALLADDQVTKASELYAQLSANQWSAVDRAAALIDQQQRLQAAGQTDAAASVTTRLRDLALDEQQMMMAQNYLLSLE